MEVISVADSKRKSFMKTKDDLLLNRFADTLIHDFGLDGVSFNVDRTKGDNQNYRFRIKAEAEDELKDGLIKRVVSIIKPAFSRAFLQFLNDKEVIDIYFEDSESDSLEPYRDEFFEWITADECSYLRTTLPALTKRVIVTGKTYKDVAGEMFTRLDSCYTDVCETLLDGRRFTEIKSISSDSGDVHNNGHTTSIISTDAGKIVYKPHDVGIDLSSYQLINTYFSDVMKAPRACSYDGFGFAEFIENAPSDTEEGAKRYFYNLGGFVSVVQMLGSTDLHHNNILASGDKPVVIDYELMITPSSRRQDDSLANDFRYSVYFSTLMPSRRGDTELSVLFGRDDGNLSAPVVDGGRKVIMDYPQEFFAGFRDIYRRCMEHKDEIKKYIISMKGLYVRHIYRGTKTYSELLQKTLEPAWIEAPDLRSSLFDALSVAMKRSGASQADSITGAETDALIRGDIPYIYTRTDTRDLYADGHVVFKDFFRVSCIDNILSRVDYMSEKDLSFEETLLRKSMERVISRQKRDEEENRIISEQLEISDEKLLQRAEEIFVSIADDAVVTPSGRLCWFGPNYFLETGMNLLSNGLIDGTSGLAVFFSMVYRYTKNERLRTRAKELIDIITGYVEKSVEALSEMEVIYPNIENTSMSSGISGKLMAFRMIGRNIYEAENASDKNISDKSTPVGSCIDKRYMSLCRKILQLIEKMDISYEKTDIFNGLSGLIKVLCRYDEFYNEEGVPEIIGRLADRMLALAGIPYKGMYLWKTLSPDWALSGAGHGQSGVASALFLAGKRLGREDLIKAAYSGFDFERDIYNKEKHAWPDRRFAERSTSFISGYCSGAPGIGMNIIETGYKNSDDVLKLAVESVLDQPLIYKDILCCGNSACIEFLLQAGKYLNDESLIVWARTRMALVIERAERNGYYSCTTRSIKSVFSPNLFYGVAGIGFEMYRLAFPDETESILL